MITEVGDNSGADTLACGELGGVTTATKMGIFLRSRLKEGGLSTENVSKCEMSGRRNKRSNHRAKLVREAALSKRA